ncbi:MAG: hypothetical protein F4059_00095 [Gemmatimonadetes bacterium]|nr:hypothetical protein [Gemmatimonadota bacterium]
MVAITARVNIDPALRRLDGLRQFPRLYAKHLRTFGDRVAVRETDSLRAVAQVNSGAQRASIGWRRKDRRRFGVGATVRMEWRFGFGVRTALPTNRSGKPYYQYTRAPVQMFLAARSFRRGIEAATDAARTKALADIRRELGA